MFEHLEDLQLTVLVAFILENLLNGDCLTCFSDCGFEDNSERAITDDLLCVIGE
jgi:hypothetical protein